MIAEDLGRIFEVGFNLGILAYIQERKLSHHFGDLYRQDLQQLSFPKMLKELIRDANLIGSLDTKIIEKWSLFLLQKGFVAGLNFFREYLQSTQWNLNRLNILYYQCSFAYQNSLRTYQKSQEVSFKEVLSQFGALENLDSLLQRYAKKGEFLQADTLLLLQYQKKLRILCVDLSVFSPQSALETLNLSEVEVMRKILIKEVHYLRSKSVFSNLRIDTSTLGIDFSEELRRFFTAFKYQDKETTKLIQAGSYAESFYHFLQAQRLIPDGTEIFFNIAGYSDRGMSAFSLGLEQIKVLTTCAQIYKHEPRGKDISEVRQDVLKAIQLNAAHSFQDGKNFVQRLLAMNQETLNPVCHSERIENFSSSIDPVADELATQLQIPAGLNLRQAHAQLIIKALNSQNPYLFLTGNPGIGKTTAIVNFLKQHLEDGFLFFYASPRKQVNLDIVEKFRSATTGLLSDDRLFCINTNAALIKNNAGRCTVQYVSNARGDDFIQNTVHFLSANSEIPRPECYQSQVHRKTETSLGARPVKSRGVLNSICEALHTLIEHQISNHLVATVSIQSLKVTDKGQNTLQHFEKIFQTAYNKREGKAIPAKMQQLAGRMKHLFIMIDEITGDDGGVEFLNGISKLIETYELTRHGFNTKIIVADASIVDPDVIEQHLNQTTPEPDKIYFKKLRNSEEASFPLQVIPFTFKRVPATVINANSYPASSLQIEYKVFIEALQLNQNSLRLQKNHLVKRVQQEIVQDLQEILSHPNPEQVIVYIQDKQRLAELIEHLKTQRSFEADQDYLEVHANLSEADKEKIQTLKNQVQVVFMTASGSRGLSFPKTKYILVDIPRFQIEKNLMEIVQVIYRGRGNDETGRTLDGEAKTLIFYLGDQVVVDETEKERSLLNSKLTLLNMLLILKTSIMTRLQGWGKLGREKFLMIPIGGKSVSAAGHTFTSQMVHLIKELKNEHRRYPGHQQLREIYLSLENIFSQAEFVLRSSQSFAKPWISYLTIHEIFPNTLCKSNSTLAGLLDYGNLEAGYMAGSLVIVPLSDQKLEETYQIRLVQHIQKSVTKELLQKMQSVSKHPSYPESLQAAIKGGAIELVKLLKGVEKSQRFEQDSQRFDQYYAIPLFALINREEMADYFAQKPAEPDDQRFRDILSHYIRALYPTDTILPIGDQYQEFPFIVFRSYSLESLRAKMFTNQYLLTSNELNVLNLILSKSLEPDSLSTHP